MKAMIQKCATFHAIFLHTRRSVFSGVGQEVKFCLWRLATGERGSQAYNGVLGTADGGVKNRPPS